MLAKPPESNSLEGPERALGGVNRSARDSGREEQGVGRKKEGGGKRKKRGREEGKEKGRGKENSKCWQGCGEIETFVHCWWTNVKCAAAVKNGMKN